MAHDDNGSPAEAEPTFLGEDSLIALIRKRFVSPRPETLGIGDDAAVLKDSRPSVLTTDLLIEGIDFLADTPGWFVGRKSLAANLSDLAAMGAEPDSFLLTLGIPRRYAELEELIDGLAEKAEEHRIELVGGDLSESDRLLVSITAVGRLSSDRPLLRSDAKVDESIFVSRPLGGPAAGLELLRRGWRLERDGVAKPPEDPGYELRELAASMLRAQLDPEPENELGLRLVAYGSVGACIDLSDGISRDLPRICEASGVGATIEWERIPIVQDLDRLGSRLAIDSAFCALHGGEEFSLLFTAKGGEAQLSSTLGRPVYKIGRIESEPGVRLDRGGQIAPLPQLGFDHFSTRSVDR